MTIQNHISQHVVRHTPVTSAAGATIIAVPVQAADADTIQEWQKAVGSAGKFFRRR